MNDRTNIELGVGGGEHPRLLIGKFNTKNEQQRPREVLPQSGGAKSPPFASSATRIAETPPHTISGQMRLFIYLQIGTSKSNWRRAGRGPRGQGRGRAQTVIRSWETDSASICDELFNCM